MRISDWSSDVCSSDLTLVTNLVRFHPCNAAVVHRSSRRYIRQADAAGAPGCFPERHIRCNMSAPHTIPAHNRSACGSPMVRRAGAPARSEEHTSELQSLLRISYAVFCLKKKKFTTIHK